MAIVNLSKRFSVDTDNMKGMTKEEFVKTWAGKIDVDINEAWKNIEPLLKGEEKEVKLKDKAPK